MSDDSIDAWTDLNEQPGTEAVPKPTVFCMTRKTFSTSRWGGSGSTDIVRAYTTKTAVLEALKAERGEQKIDGHYVIVKDNDDGGFTIGGNMIAMDPVTWSWCEIELVPE
jgi:hypothetical protein